MTRPLTQSAASQQHELPPSGPVPGAEEARRQANPSIGADKPSLLANPSSLTGGAGAPFASTGIIADASKVSPRTFLEALGLTSPEMREARRKQEIERCIRAIERGDTYGFPPVMVAECRHIMAMRAEVRF